MQWSGRKRLFLSATNIGKKQQKKCRFHVCPTMSVFAPRSLLYFAWQNMVI